MIQSHFNPIKNLKQHIEEVKEAAHIVLKRHNKNLQTVMKEWIYYTIMFHDLGKAIKEFQIYIKDPKHYKGAKIDKSHAPVSFFWWCTYFKKNNIDPQTAIAVSVAVWKHHGNFPLFSESNGLEYALSVNIEFIREQLENYPINQINDELGIKLHDYGDSELLDISDFFDDNRPNKCNIEAAALFRIKVQFLFSVLLEADRAFLALYGDDYKYYSANHSFNFPPDIVDKYLKTKEIPELSEFNKYRNNIRNNIIEKECFEVSTISLPTGMGKTMIAADWALKYRKIIDENIERKIIIILPFLSIIDQTVKEYKKLFHHFEIENILLESHSLAERKYCDDSEEEESQRINNSIDFLHDTWHKPIVITTFDQFLLTLFSSKGCHQLRMNNLVDALIIMDEIQAIPTLLWDPLSLALNSLTKAFNSKVLIMSATQPGFIKSAKELVDNHDKIFASRNRYKIILRHHSDLPINNFINECQERLKKEWKDKRVLIVLNTRASARFILNSLEKSIKTPIYFLSADIIPQERIENIYKIKENNPCFVIATQCIEAGVDIDMDIVIRDFAPLDSIIQVAGRCNRNGLKQRSNVELIKLANENGKNYFKFVYTDSILIENTIEVLNTNKNNEILEENIYKLVESYYILTNKKKDKGMKYAKDWAYWRNEIDIKKILRGDAEKINFVVIKADKPNENELPLSEAIEIAVKIEDRWERKRQLKALSGRIAKLTVSVWATYKFNPEFIAKKIGPWLLLNDEYYDTGKGINIEKTSHSLLCF